MSKEKNRTVSIVSDYRDVTVGKYQSDILPIIKKADQMDPLDLQVALIAALNNLTDVEVLNLPVPQYTEYALATKFLEKPVDASHAGRIASRYTLGEFTLVPVQDFEKMTAGQFIDFQQLSGDVEKNAIALLSVYLVPEGKKYNDGYDIREVQRAIADHLNVQDAFGILAFFLARSLKLQADSLSSSKGMIRGLKNRKARKELLKRVTKAEALLRNGDGSPTSTS